MKEFSGLRSRNLLCKAFISYRLLSVLNFINIKPKLPVKTKRKINNYIDLQISNNESFFTFQKKLE